ncbi:MAG: universal stress protein, partial [Acidimicrobiaceae bacterium]|nr:universal stress protein [Acidimicrobiaceae bacterium]
VGSRGLGRIRRHVLGSTSHAVLRHSPVPVAIVPGQPSFALAQEGSGVPGLVEA